ncbi:hypothetical protein ABEW34_15385 [Paenibacillus algorifonticola]|uniref:hypothetical protein n=1 Tax=Paenibacillus algorifonticola TaxID=684063 RepID=UPI003D2CE075
MTKIFKWSFIFLSIFFTFNLAVAANELDSDVKIIVNSQKENYSKKMNVNLTVVFNNKELYSDKVFVAYHLYDNNNKEILWEGKRYPLSINDDGVGKLTFDIDLALKSTLANVDYAKVDFDLVDEENAYWFSTYSNITLATDHIIYQNDRLKEMLFTLSSSIKSHPVIFSINILFFLLFIYGFYKIRKHELF